MEVLSFLLADHAEAVNGKLYMTGGGWNTLGAPTLPYQHVHMSLAVALEVPWSATNQEHRFRILLVDEDGRPQGAEMGANLEIGRPPGMRSGDVQNVIFCFGLDGLTLEKAGQYSFELEIDGSVEAHARFRLLEVSPKAISV